MVRILRCSSRKFTLFRRDRSSPSRGGACALVKAGYRVNGLFSFGPARQGARLVRKGNGVETDVHVCRYPGSKGAANSFSSNYIWEE